MMQRIAQAKTSTETLNKDFVALFKELSKSKLLKKKLTNIQQEYMNKIKLTVLTLKKSGGRCLIHFTIFCQNYDIIVVQIIIFINK